MSIIFKNKNLDTITPAEAKQMELDYINDIMESFEYSRLCDSIGRQIVAEYEFKGTKDVVWEQLISYQNDIANKEFTQDDLEQMKIRKNRVIMFDDSEAKCHAELKSIIKERDMEKLIKHTSLVMEGSQAMHGQGMCLCFNNK